MPGQPDTRGGCIRAWSGSRDVAGGVLGAAWQGGSKRDMAREASRNTYGSTVVSQAAGLGISIQM